MLGRWDATNIVDAQVAVITNIGLDHTEFAGPTLADIARRRPASSSPGAPWWWGRPTPTWSTSSLPRAERRTSCEASEFETIDNSLAVGGRALDMRTPTTIYHDVFVPLHGAHQGDNAAVALTAVEAFFAAPLENDLVHEGFANVEMPGRFEVLGVQPLAIIDGAHNPPGADVCASVFFDDFHPEGRRILVMGTPAQPGRDARRAARRRVRRRPRAAPRRHLVACLGARRGHALPASWAATRSTCTTRSRRRARRR